MTLFHIIQAMKLGWHCWSEIHPYGSHFVGTWREWLCSAPKLCSNPDAALSDAGTVICNRP
jgi:hypothetical protein